MRTSKARARTTARRRHRRLTTMEALEGRRLLAGDIHAFAHDGHLVISGDHHDNSVLVAPGAEGGVEVTGRDGTRVNGGSGATFFHDGEGVPRDLVVSLAGGNDLLTIENIHVGDDLHADTASGNDHIAIHGGSVEDRVSIRPGSGHDRVSLQGSEEQKLTARSVYISDSTGDDGISLQHVQTSRDLYVRGGSGDDRVAIQNAHVGDDLRVHGNSGDDVVAILASNVTDDTTVRTGSDFGLPWSESDHDRAVILNSTHGDLASLALGRGDDFLGVADVAVGGPVSVAAGPGADDVGLQDSAFAGYAFADGGWNTDGLFVDEVEFGTPPKVRNFETGVDDFAEQVDQVLDDLEEAGLLAPKLDSITDIVVENENFSTLEAAVIAAGLAETLDGDGTFTVFAPTNAAFDALPDGTLDALLADPAGQLTDILLYHAAGEEVFAEQIVTLETVDTLLGEPITVEVTEAGVVLNGSVNVTATDIEASNGVVHVIDAVLLPPPAPSITDIVVENENFSTLEAAVIAAGLAETLDGDGTFTVFAPTNAAFDALPDGTLDALLADPAGQLTDILLYHAAGEEVFAEQIVTLETVDTLLGEPITVEVTEAGVVLNGSVNVTATDIEASNGVVHVIDAVLLPPGPSITDIVVENENFSTLEAAVIAAGLAETLDGDGTFTVFAPTNAAFDALPDGTLDALLADPAGQLTDILLYHAAGEEVFAEQIVTLETVDTLLGEPITVEVTEAGVVLNGSVNVTATDIEASNGVVHVIDAVLLPPGPSITDIVVENENFSTLEAAVIAAGLAETLDGDGTFTVFAPTNAAFDALPDGTLDALLADPAGQLTDILLYHAAGEEVFAEQIVTLETVDTLLGEPITVEVTEAGVVLNGSVNVTATDIEASNGVIHVIDAVLLPPMEGPTQTIAEIVAESDDFETLESLLTTFDLTDTLDNEDNSFTVFAPTDDAFEELPSIFFDVVLKFFPFVFERVLLNHVIDTSLSSAELATLEHVDALGGTTLSIDTTEAGLVINDRVHVTVADVEATNGTIHVIDTLILRI